MGGEWKWGIDRPLYVALQYIYYFLMTNIYFMLANILFLVIFLFVELTLDNILLFYLALLPAGPAFAALFASMGKLVREKEISPTKDFWSYYKKNFMIGTKYWLLKWTILVILLLDLRYTGFNIQVLTPIIFILIIVALLILLYAFPILTRFEVKIKNLWLVAIYANFKFFKTTLLNLSTFVSLGVIYYFAPSITIWFCMSIATFFIMFNMRKPFEVMELEMSNENKERKDEKA
ncbi:DUF624 domain-containing protein [Gracilibacillus sp. JCM 18860]|uniref:DUF624 domain-containing protein n=1 Tax=Gracilibacillus sp. JCM 18860 TaxID=1306159 RepID=UPI0006D083C2